MITLTATADYGQTGQYIARITGRDAKFTFEREFIGHKGGRRGETSSADVDEPGLYELCDVTKKGGKNCRYRILVEHQGKLVCIVCGKEDAMAIAKRMTDQALDEIIEVTPSVEEGKFAYRIRTPGEARRATTAQTRESAIAACWAAIEALPASEAKKVLTELRRRLAPPEETGADAQEEAGESHENQEVRP